MTMSASRSIPSGTVEIEVDRQYPVAAVQVSHLDMVERQHYALKTGASYRVDLCLTPRLPSTMRFDRWAANRFEQPGRLFVMPPGEGLAIWNHPGRESVIVAHLFTDAMSRWMGEAFEPDGDPIDSSMDIGSPVLEQLMLRLREEVRAPGFAADVMIEALAMQIAVEVQRHYRAAPSPLSHGGLAPWRLRRIEDRLKSSDHPASLSELAEICGLSVRHLSRGFRASRGIAIGHYVAGVRIERAKAMLADDTSIKSVAGRLGFSSTAAFCAAFRSATGVTPRDYRRLIAS